MDGYQTDQITIFSCSPRTKGATGSEPSETNRVVAKEDSVPAHLKTRGSIMPQVLKLSLSAVAGLMLLTAVTPAMAYTGQELAKDAKISIKQARAIALKAHPGEITDEKNWRRKEEAAGSGIPSTSNVEESRRRSVSMPGLAECWRTRRKVRARTDLVTR